VPEPMHRKEAIQCAERETSEVSWRPSEPLSRP
jgi:hypothetical protein